MFALCNKNPRTSTYGFTKISQGPGGTNDGLLEMTGLNATVISGLLSIYRGVPYTTDTVFRLISLTLQRLQPLQISQG